MFLKTDNTYTIATANDLTEISRGKFIKTIVCSENNDGDIDLTEHCEFISLFKKTSFAFEKGSRKMMLIIAARGVFRLIYLSLKEKKNGTYTERLRSFSKGKMSIFRLPMIDERSKYSRNG